MPLTYKVVEVSPVDDVSLEKVVNEKVSEGWSLDHIQFVRADSSKRPVMAFVFFTRDDPPASGKRR